MGAGGTCVLSGRTWIGALPGEMLALQKVIPAAPRGHHLSHMPPAVPSPAPSVACTVHRAGDQLHRGPASAAASLVRCEAMQANKKSRDRGGGVVEAAHVP